jgi:hypothetical protein
VLGGIAAVALKIRIALSYGDAFSKKKGDDR